MREYPLSTIHAAMALADEAEACGEATLQLNGYIFTLTEPDDFQLLEIIMQHRSSAAKVLELLANLTEAVEMAEVAA
jgi:hypothetical protein